MAQPVTIVDAGGLPVTNTSSLLAGTPMTPVDAGGMPVTLVDAGGYPVALINEDGTLWDGAPFDPTSLFTGSDAGAIIDNTDAANLFELSTASGDVTYNDPIGYSTDLGPSAKPALQATTADRPIWNGWPSTFASDIVTNGQFATDTDWTKGTGWTIAGGKASKSAGTASVLSQALTLTAGKAYLVEFMIECTAGTVFAQFTGGTTVAGFSRNYVGGYFDILVAVTGNTTLEFSADSAFAGSVSNVVVREVSTWVNEGAYFRGSASCRLRTAAIDLSGSNKGTMIVSFRHTHSSSNQYIAMFGGTGQLTSFAARRASGVVAEFTGTVGAVTTSAINDDAARSLDGILSIIVDSDETTAANQIRVRSRGLEATETNTGTPVTTQSLASNGVWSLGSPFNNNSWFSGHIRRALLINRILTTDELEDAEAWVKQGACYGGIIGDSTVDANVSADLLPNSYGVGSLVGGLITGSADVSKVGDKIADQLTLWNAAPGRTNLECVFIQIGLNDVKGRVGEGLATTAQVITDLQALVDDVRADTSAACKIYVSQMVPCKAWLDLASNPSAAYSAWQAVNEAIAGNGSTPITGVNGRITSHVTSLNDGGDNLQTIYKNGSDDVHPNSRGKLIIAKAWRTQLEADGLV